MELYAEISSENANFKKAYKSLTDFANDSYQWYQVAEMGFDSFMVRNRLTG
jgi:TRAP-type mannitol/chloroaromatic compound transport system substrate-binding protein